jgi:cell division protein FtsB
MRRFTVMGFTEAELGFVLAAVFAALAASALAPQANAVNLAAKNDTLSAKNDTLSKKYDSVSTAFAAYRDSVRKKSNKTPRCSEKGEPADPIADLRILGRNSYGIGGERLSLRGLEARLAPQIERSITLGCHYLVRTIATPGVDSPDHSAAVVKLWARFDVSERQK